jgi:hypothetical protein
VCDCKTALIEHKRETTKSSHLLSRNPLAPPSPFKKGDRGVFVFLFVFRKPLHEKNFHQLQRVPLLHKGFVLGHPLCKRGLGGFDISSALRSRGVKTGGFLKSSPLLFWKSSVI